MAYLIQDDYFWIHPLIFKFYNFISLNLMNSILLCECIEFSLAVHWLIDINPSCFQVLHIMNRTVMNMSEKGSLEYDLESFGYILKGYEAGSSGRSSPGFPSKHHIDFHSSFTSLHFHQQ